MESAKRTAGLLSRAMPSFAILASLYLLLIYVLPANPRALTGNDLSPLEYRIFLTAVSLPSIIVWFSAFWGFAKLGEYARSVRDTPEGIHFASLARGAAWLAWSLPVPAIMALILNTYAGHQPDFLPTAIIVVNYLNLLLPLVAFTLIGSSSRGLINTTRARYNMSSVRSMMLGFAAGGVLYCYLIFKLLDLGTLGSTANPFYLPLWLVVTSVIIPYLYMWFIGIVAAYEIKLYSQRVSGLLYRRALRTLMIGLIIVIASSIVLQYLNTVQPSAGYIQLKYKLLAVMAFRLIEGVGFVLLAVGASRLRKFEEL